MAPSASSPAARLKMLREKLQLSQRELAKEFKVTGGAIAHWENGSRPIPGPILKLMEIYEEHLDADLKSREVGHQFRTLSVSWTDRILSLLNSPKSDGTRTRTRERLQETLFRYLRRELPPGEVGRKVQLALIERVVQSIELTKGLPMKAVQLLTYMDPSISMDIREILSSIEANQRAMAPSVAARVIFEELRDSPNNLFAKWNPRPFAIASIGQVHEATLRNGERVAVKVQYPEVAESIRADLRALGFLHDVAALIKPGNRAVVQEIQETVLAECDYEREAANQEAFGNLFAGDPNIVIPKVYPQFSGKRVLTTEYIDGQLMPEFLANSSQNDRNLAARTYYKFVVRSLFRGPFMHADHNARNFLFLGGGRVAFLDFGRVVRFERELMEIHRRLVVGVIRRDKELVHEAVRKLDFVKDWDTFDFDEFWEILLEQQGHLQTDVPFTFTKDFLLKFQRVSRSFPDKKNFRITSDMLWSTCSSFGSYTLLAELGACDRWGEMFLSEVEN